MKIARVLRTSSILAVLAALESLAAGPAHASFSGTNQGVAYLSIPCGFPCTQYAVFVSGNQVTFPSAETGESDREPSFSPDGTRIAYVKLGVNSSTALAVMGADGSNPVQILDSAAFIAARGDPSLQFAIFSRPAWSLSGKRIAFAVTAQGKWAEGGIFTVKPDGSDLQLLIGNGSDTDQTALDPTWSPIGKKLAFRCRFRVVNNRLRDDLCVFDSNSGVLQYLPIDFDTIGLDGGTVLTSPSFTPDGQRLVFTSSYYSADIETFQDQFGGYTGQVPEADVFSVRVDGSGLQRLTQSPAVLIPPPAFPRARGLISYSRVVPSPDGRSLIAQGQRVDSAGKSEIGLWTLDAKGQGPSFQIPNASPAGLDWQPTPVSLSMVVTDGHDDPLDGLEVQLCTPAGCGSPGNVVDGNPTNHLGGSYAFDNVPTGRYVVRITLVDHSEPAGSAPAFEIRNGADPTGAAWIERTVSVTGTGPLALSEDFADGEVADSNVPSNQRDRLDDLAAIYYRLHQFVNWAKRNLQTDMGPGVPVLAFLSQTPSGDPIDPLDAAFSPFYGVLWLGTDISTYEARDGKPDSSGEADIAPQNAEWHEFTHYLANTFIKTISCDGVNHAGYSNPSSCDSLSEGFAMFLPTLAAQEIESSVSSRYDDFMDLEWNVKAWGTRLTRTTHTQLSTEDVAVSGLLWDLVDSQNDSEMTAVISEIGTQVPCTLTDTTAIPIGQLWSVLTGSHPGNVYELHQALLDPTYALPGTAVTVELDGMNAPDVAPVDIPFLMHGFFPVGAQQTPTGPLLPYYDVGAAQTSDPTLAKNAWVGRTDHLVLSSQGILLHSWIPRLNIEENTGAQLQIDVQDASGTPLSGAQLQVVEKINVPPDTPGSWLNETWTAPLGSGDGELFHYEPPLYDRFLRPPDAEPAPCDPANDLRVTVTLSATVNGYTSTDHPTFDNCSYWQAVYAANGSPAAVATFHFPEDSTPPVSQALAGASDATVGNQSPGYWIVEIACNDPVDGGFASGCASTEYTLDGGPVTPYQHSLTLETPGVHTIEYRSVDAAGNQESFQSISFGVGVGTDSDGDGLSDSLEATFHTNPNDPDTDHDGLEDGDEIARGTDPLATDSDGDGVPDGVEVSQGTNPLDADTDHDGVPDGVDNCPRLANPDQVDTNGNGVGNACEIFIDGFESGDTSAWSLETPAATTP